MPLPSKSPYQFSGSLPPDAPSYVERKADRELYEQLKKGQCCYVFNSRQMGKSSLRVRTINQLQEVGIACAVIDPQRIGTQLREDQWYAGVIKDLVKSFRLGATFGFPAWWRELEAQSISSVQRFYYFIEEVLLVQIQQPIVIFIEEIDSLLSLEFKIDDFFILIRSFYENRALHPEYNRLNFALIGVTTPMDLIRDRNRSAFNIGLAVEMSGFTLEEAEPLAKGLAGKVSEPEAVLSEVLQWTGGQPFLTQKLLNLVLKEAEARKNFHPDWVTRVVREGIIENWEAQDSPQHLKTLQERILRLDEQGRGRLLGLYQQILIDGGIDADSSYEQMHLRLTGLVLKREGKLQVYNPIYQEIFNLQWVDKALADLRPSFYAEALRSWKELAEQNESFLLRGQALADAEEWAKGKHLSDEDERFLAASWEVEKRESDRLEAERQAREIAEKRREAVEEANRILTKAQQQSEQEIIKGRKTRNAAFVAAVIAGVFAVGGFAFATKQISEVNYQKKLASKAQTENALANVRLNSVNAEVTFLDGSGLDAVLQAVRAGYKLKQIPSFGQDKNTFSQVSSVLAQTVNQVQEQNRLEGHQDSVFSANFSPDGSKIVTASDDKTARVWDVQGHLLHQLTGHQKLVISASFSPDGSKIVTASFDNTARVWDVQGNLLHQLTGHQRRVNRASFSPDGSKIVTASDDKTARVWDVQGNLLHELKGHQGGVRSVSFSPDGSKIVTASDDKTARVWSGIFYTDFDKLLTRGCQWLQDYLTTNPNAQESDKQMCRRILQR